jgi:hypothetical protein
MSRVEFDPRASANTAAALAAVGSLEDGRLLIEREKGKPSWIGKRGPDLDASRETFARDFLKKLNKELWLDGMWAVGWVNWTFQKAAYTECVWIYLDKDMDVQFVVNCDDSIEIMWNHVHEYMDQCVAAYMVWREQLKIVGVRPEQKIKAAIGQASADKSADPGIDLLSLG